MFKNRARTDGVGAASTVDGKVGPGVAGSRRERARRDVYVERRFRRLEAVAERRPGLEEAAREVAEDDRRAKLADFKRRRAEQRAADKVAKRQPFRVGVYKLDGNFPPPSTDKRKATAAPKATTTTTTTTTRTVASRREIPAGTSASSRGGGGGGGGRKKLNFGGGGRTGGGGGGLPATAAAAARTPKNKTSVKNGLGQRAARSPTKPTKKALPSRQRKPRLRLGGEEQQRQHDEGTTRDTKAEQEMMEEPSAATAAEQAEAAKEETQVVKVNEVKAEGPLPPPPPSAPASRRRSSRIVATATEDNACSAAKKARRRSSRKALAFKEKDEKVEDGQRDEKADEAAPAKTPVPDDVRPPRRSMRLALKTATPTASASSSTSLTPALEAMKINLRSTAGRTPNPFSVRFLPDPKMDFNFGDGNDDHGGDGGRDQAEDQGEEEADVFRFRGVAAAPPKRDADGFLTPTALKRNRSARRSTRFSGLLDSLRHDVVFARGSNSDKRKNRKAGERSDTPRKTPGWQQDMLRGVPDDSTSPVFGQIESVYRSPAASKEEADLMVADILDSASKDGKNAGRRSATKAAAARTNLADAMADLEEEEGGEEETVVHDATYFRALLSRETDRLESLCSEWEAKAAAAEATVPASTLGQIRAAVGKARLLTAGKGRFEQFSGLVDACQNGTGVKKTTAGDLQGFWDMVAFQVEDVNGLFADLKELEDNAWVAKEPETMDENKRPKKKKKMDPAARKKRAAPNAALRKMMAAGRKEVAQAKADKEAGSELAPLLSARTPSSVLRPVNKSKEKVFEAGFFHVRSPIRGGGVRGGVGGGSKIDFDKE